MGLLAGAERLCGSSRSDACNGWSLFDCVRCASTGCALPPLPLSAAATGRAVGLDELQPTQTADSAQLKSYGEAATSMAARGILAARAANRRASQAVRHQIVRLLAGSCGAVGAYEAARACEYSEYPVRSVLTRRQERGAERLAERRRRSLSCPCSRLQHTATVCSRLSATSKPLEMAAASGVQ